MRAFLEKLGIFPFAGTRTVWVVADSVAELESAGPLFESFRERLARIDVAVSSRGGERGALATALPKCFAVPLPWPLASAATACKRARAFSVSVACSAWNLRSLEI